MTRVARIVTGTALVLLGMLLLVLPGPGIVTIAAGLAILATEFTWARTLLDWLKTRFKSFFRNGMGDPSESLPREDRDLTAETK